MIYPMNQQILGNLTIQLIISKRIQNFLQSLLIYLLATLSVFNWQIVSQILLLFYTPLIYSEHHIKNFVQAIRISGKRTLKTNNRVFENPNLMLLQLQNDWEWYHLRDGDACLTVKVPFLSQIKCFDVKWMDNCLSLSLIEMWIFAVWATQKALLEKNTDITKF